MGECGGRRVSVAQTDEVIFTHEEKPVDRNIPSASL
jgi:hypothetical protein